MPYVLYGIILIALIILVRNIRIVPQAQAYVITRLGAYKTTWGVGLHLKVPFIESVAKRLSLKEQVADFPPPPVITKDNVTMQIDTVVYYQITDPKLYTYGIEQPILAIENLSATTLRNLIGDLELDQCLTSRDIVNTKMRQILDEATDPWGIKVNRVELKNILPPKEIQNAMEKQMKAERERREAILRAEGEKRSAILMAEGEKESAVLRADAKKQEQILEAQGRAEAILTVQRATAEGIRLINESMPSDAVIKLKSLEAFAAAADGRATKIIIPSEIQDNGFSYTLGAGGVSTGSKSVLTINLNRCIQYAERQGIPYLSFLEEVVDLTHKVQLAYNENLKELQRKGMLPLFDAGYINLSRQYLTIGINGLVEAAEYKGIAIVDNPDYVRFTEEILGLIERYNHKYRSKEVMFNCEMIPAENVGVKHAKWDREDGYKVPRDCYNSYFYVVEDTTLNIADKFRLHGAQYIAHLTGGSALHMNLEEHLSQPQYRHLLRVAAQEGCNYFTFNIPNTVCNDCGHIDKRYLKECPRCHSTNLDYLTRVIGYMKRISNFSQARQQEAARRYYNRPERIEGGVEERSVAAPRRDE